MLHSIKIIIWSSLLYYLFLCLCARNFSHFMEKPWCGKFMCYGLFRLSACHRVWTHVLIVPCVVSHKSYPLDCSATKLWSIYRDIYFGWNNASYKKNKRLIILMFLRSKMYKKFFILRLISSHPLFFLKKLFYV